MGMYGDGRRGYMMIEVGLWSRTSMRVRVVVIVVASSSRWKCLEAHS
jgi:hypothetical protein